MLLDGGEVGEVVSDASDGIPLDLVIPGGGQFQDVAVAPGCGFILEDLPIGVLGASEGRVAGEQQDLGMLVGNLVDQPLANPRIGSRCD
jgi:hypothetical protein